MKKIVFISFHNHYKVFWYGVISQIRGIFHLYLFWDKEKWQLNWRLSIIWDIISVTSIARSELTRLKFKWTRKWKGKCLDKMHHSVWYEIPLFIWKNGRPMGFFSEQKVEHVHQVIIHFNPTYWVIQHITSRISHFLEFQNMLFL